MMNKRKFLLMILLSLFIIIIGSWFSIKVINKQGKKEIGKFISTVNLTTLQGLHSWADRHYLNAKHEARKISLLINELGFHGVVVQKPANSSAQSLISSALSPLLKLEGYEGYVIVSSNDVILCSSNNDWVGQQNVFHEQEEILQKIWSGETMMSNPFYSNPDSVENSLNMFVGTPLVDNSEKIVAILLLTIDPYKNFTKIFEQGRIGSSGENYAIDKKGRLLSKSRFVSQLVKENLLKPDKREVLNISIPGDSRILSNYANSKLIVDSSYSDGITWNSLANISGMDLDGYADYRGINVVGAWTWDEELNMIVVTELDVDEAFMVFNQIQFSILLLFFIWGGVFFIVVIVFYYWYKQLNQKEKIYEELFNNSPLGIYQTSPDGIILNANKTLLDMMGYHSLSDLQARNLEKEGYSKESTVDRKQFKEIIERDGYVNGIEASWDTVGGTILYIRENATAVRDKSGKTLYYEGTVEDISRQKRAERELESQKEFLRMIIDVIPNLIFVKDWDGRFTLVNEKMAELFGCSVEDIIGKTELEINPNKENIKKFLKDDREVMETLQPKIITEEIFNNKRTGEIRWFDTTKVPLITSNGEYRQVLGVATDITKRKQTEETIRQISDRLQLATQTANIGIWDLNIVTKKLVWDEVMFSLYGITPETFSGTNEAWESSLHPEDKERLMKEMQMVMQEKRVFDTEFRIIRPDNSIRYLKTSCLVQRDVDGKPIRMLGTNWDITLLVEAKKEIEKRNKNLESLVEQRTLDLVQANKSLVKEVAERKQVEKSLLENTEIVRTIFEVVPDAIVTIDSRGRIKSFNPAAVKLFGYSYEDVFDKNVSILMPAPFHSKHDEYIKTYLKSNESKVIGIGRELIAKHKNGTVFPIELAIAEMIVNQEKMFTGVITDITERKQFTEKLEKAKEKAEIANRAKSEFLANMSHEIRTPLNAIIGFTELLNATITEPKQKSQLQSIRTSGKSLLTLINDILDLSKIEANKLELKLDSLNPHLFFKEFQNIFSAILDQKKLNYNLEMDDSIPSSLLLDEIRLRQVLFNLIGNAIKFTGKGSILVKIFKNDNKEISNQIDLVIQVKDTGIGIAPDQQKLIFDAFKQQERTSHKYKGTGLGLTISKKLVEMMGGTISVKSKLEQGSVFEIVLKNVAVTDTPAEQKKELNFDPEAVQFKGAKILVVDDVKINRILIADLFENSNVTLINAENGKKAIELAREHLPDLILMDLKMPVMSGDQAVEILSKDERTKSIPVILITASVLNDDHLGVTNEMIKGYLSKPLNLYDMVEALKKHLLFELKTKTNNVAIKETMSLEKLSEEAMNKLPKIIDDLENDYLEKYKDVLDNKLIDEFENFGIEIVEYAKTNSIEYLQTLGEQIGQEAQNYNIEKTMELLQSFPEVINQLKLLLNKK